MSKVICGIIAQKAEGSGEPGNEAINTVVCVCSNVVPGAHLDGTVSGWLAATSAGVA